MGDEHEVASVSGIFGAPSQITDATPKFLSAMLRTYRAEDQMKGAPEQIRDATEQIRRAGAQRLDATSHARNEAAHRTDASSQIRG